MVLATVLLLSLAASARAQQVPSVRLHVLADTLALGEPFEVAVAADHAPGVQALFPDVPRDRTPESGPLLALGDAEATDRRRLAPVLRGDIRTDSVVYRALAFGADSVRVGPAEVAFVSGGDTVRVASPSALVRIRQLVPGPDAEPEPPAEPFPFPSPTPVWIALGALALLVLGGGAWLAIRLLRRPRRTSRTPRLLPYPEALAGLDALAEPLPTPRTAQPWLVELADVLRTYVERRLGVPAKEQTTRELDLALAPHLPNEPRRLLRGVLRVCDQGKFADLRPGSDSAREVLDQSRASVEAMEAVVREREARRAQTEAEA